MQDLTRMTMVIVYSEALLPITVISPPYYYQDFIRGLSPLQPFQKLQSFTILKYSSLCKLLQQKIRLTNC